MGEALLARFQRGTIQTIVADAAYDSDRIRRTIKSLKAKACIKPSKQRKVRKRYDKQTYKNRNHIERFFNRIKMCRRVATRYEKKPDNYAGFLWIAATIYDLL